jgi:hypothetical protein
MPVALPPNHALKTKFCYGEKKAIQRVLKPQTCLINMNLIKNNTKK